MHETIKDVSQQNKSMISLFHNSYSLPKFAFAALVLSFFVCGNVGAQQAPQKVNLVSGSLVPSVSTTAGYTTF